MAAVKYSCAVCGVTMRQAGRSTAPVKCCLSCRRSLSREEKISLGILHKNTVTSFECANCGKVVSSPNAKWLHYCSRRCGGYVGKPRVIGTGLASERHKLRRRFAPGLSLSEQEKLLARWKLRGARCVYCGGPGESLDHVLPLARGGTNFVGNLAPACRVCNPAKGARTVAEWRYGRQRSELVSSAASWLSADLRPAPRPKAVKPTRAPARCRLCYAALPSGYTKSCPGHYREYQARCQRSKYRASVGLPDNWLVPTKRRGVTR